MDIQQSWKLKFSFKNATMVLFLVNVVTALFLLQGFLSPPPSSRKYQSNGHQPISVRNKLIKESDELRRAMQPLELIKRVREIEQEAYAEPETIQQKETRQTAAFDLSKRLNNFRSSTDGANQKALEEWLKRKMERARQREIGRNGTALA
ncbi:hypothetical protein V2J09_014308 [Rumex salicifolius]